MIGQFNVAEFDFVIEELDVETVGNVEHWRITSHQTKKIKDIFTEQYLPYIKLKIFNDHPLLWPYKSKELECNLSGFPKGLSEFMGDLALEYEETSGNWLPLSSDFFSMQMSYFENGRISIGIVEQLEPGIRSICEKHGIRFEVENKIEQDYSYSNLKVLIFGNSDVSPYNFNLGQPYIIAEEFFATKK